MTIEECNHHIKQYMLRVLYMLGEQDADEIEIVGTRLARDWEEAVANEWAALQEKRLRPY